MHQDHGQSPDVCQGAIDLGFSSVMMDGSLQADGKTIASYDYNVDVTRKVVDMAHTVGVTVEGELGCLGSLETMRGDKEDGHGTEATMTRDQLLTDPEQAADFVKQTQLDALAIAIGTSHGAYKFTRKPTGDILAIDRIKEIHARIPNTHLVMHGSSSVPQDLLAEIRKYGGEMKETYGVPVEEIQEAIKHGVRKINIDTDIRLAMTGAIRKYMAENPGKFDPRDYLKPAREAAKGICKQRYEQFGCAGQAAKIKAAAVAGRRVTLCARRAGASRALKRGRGVRRERAVPRSGDRSANAAEPPTTQGDERSGGTQAARMTAALLESRLRSLPLLARGKVRDNYAVGDDRLLMVATDRLSRVRRRDGRADPRQGRVAHADGAVLVRALERASCRTTSPARIPRRSSPPNEREQVRGRSMLVKRLKPLPIEAVVRGYLAGSGWKEYQRDRHGVRRRAAARAAPGEPRCPSRSSRRRPRPRSASTTRTSRSSACDSSSARRSRRRCARSRCALYATAAAYAPSRASSSPTPSSSSASTPTAR